MRQIIFYIFTLLTLFLPLLLSSAQKAHVDGSWNSPLVYAFDNNTPIKYDTAFKAEFDRKNLYITVKCSDPDAKKIGSNPRQSLRAWPMVDSVEIFLDPPQLKKYVQLAVGTNGNFYDSRKNHKEPKWKYELVFNQDHWTLKFIIPFSDLGVTAENGDSWRFNICRNVRSSDNFNSTWAHVGSAFHNPANFGMLIFGSPDSAAKANDIKMKKVLDELKKELHKKGIYSEFEDKLKAVEKNCTQQKINAIREESVMIEALKGL